ncbi:MAG: ParB/RepB/Spo0J family partition protein [Gammaproteobacteria bacterium]|nr:ParB/RepB/Spo0J family partition protein [Gammaproteobacteria bacterium]
MMAKKRGLGRSLDALLIGSNDSAHVVDSDKEAHAAAESLILLPVDQIQRGKYQPRRDMDSAALEDLAASIRAQGVIQPIVVRPVAGGRYEIVAGERRWRASQLAGRKDVPAIVRIIPDEAAVAIALIENIQRESLNPIEEAMALQRLLEEFGMTHQQVADAVGKSRASVTNLLRLLTLAATVRTMLEQNDLEMGHARALLSLPEALQIEVAQTVVQRGFSVRETEELVRQMQMPEMPATPKAIDPDVKRLQDDLSLRLRLGVAIHCNAKGRGKVVIRYNNLGELDAILEHFQD